MKIFFSPINVEIKSKKIAFKGIWIEKTINVFKLMFGWSKIVLSKCEILLNKKTNDNVNNKNPTIIKSFLLLFLELNDNSKVFSLKITSLILVIIPIMMSIE